MGNWEGEPDVEKGERVPFIHSTNNSECILCASFYARPPWQSPRGETLDRATSRDTELTSVKAK